MIYQVWTLLNTMIVSLLTPHNRIFMIFKSQMSILCVKTRDMLAGSQG